MHFGRFAFVRALVSSSNKKLVVIVPRRHVRVQSRAQSIPNKFNEGEEWSNTDRLNTKRRRAAGLSALVVRKCSEKPPKENRKESTVRKVRRLFNRYWYIIIPVYVFLDVGSASVFYLLLTRGFDLVRIMKYLDMNEQSIEKVEKRTTTPAGRLAIVFVL
uniref:DUF1279 domain-containing protein n=1 Tax=Lygus hesperus TaxID=30085 RepID=A0A0A9YCY2_LYGHE